LVPATLTSASPGDTLEAMSFQPYEWLVKPKPEEDPTKREDPTKSFSITCWFYWPAPSKPEGGKDRVLLTSTPTKNDEKEKWGAPPSVFIHYNKEEGKDQTDVEWVWIFVDKSDTERLVRTPKLLEGWHSMAIVSSKEGTTFYLDTDFKIEMKNIWLRNDFYMVGNNGPLPLPPDSKEASQEREDGQVGKKPFGLLADFRIYGHSLTPDEVKFVANSTDSEQHPDEIARLLADKDAVTILAQRLDVPDSAAECLRALGSLAALASQRAKIYKVCGPQILKMLDSPFHMIERQASRLLNNLT